jgi:hypothetical protein
MSATLFNLVVQVVYILRSLAIYPTGFLTSLLDRNNLSISLSLGNLGRFLSLHAQSSKDITHPTSCISTITNLPLSSTINIHLTIHNLNFHSSKYFPSKTMPPSPPFLTPLSPLSSPKDPLPYPISTPIPKVSSTNLINGNQPHL